MKHFNLFTLLGSAALVFTLAQPIPAAAKGNHKQGSRQSVNIEQRVEHMTKKLNLSEDQARELREILTVKREAIKALRAEESLSKAERRTKASEIHQDAHQKISGVLSPEQVQLIKAQRQAKFSKRATRNLEKLKVLLELNPKQVKTIEVIQAEHIKAKIALYEANKGDRKAIKKALKEQHQSTRKAIREQLNEEQAVKFDAMKRHHKQGRRHKRGHNKQSGDQPRKNGY